MKGNAKQIRQIIRSPNADIRLYLFLGPDEAGNARLAGELGASFGKDAERLDLSGSQLKEDPSLLAGEAASLSLFGTQRWLRVHTSGEESLAAVRSLLTADKVIHPVVMLASGISEKSRLAKEVIASKVAISCHSWLPNAKEMGALVAEMARRAGLEMDGAIATRIGEYSGADQRLAQMEIDKLALYCDASPNHPQKVDWELVASLSAAAGDDDMKPVINSVLGGNLKALSSELDRIEAMGLSEVALVLMLQRRVMLLASLAARLGGPGGVEALLEQEVRSRRVFFGDRHDVARQLRLWPAGLLMRLSERLVKLQRAMMLPGPEALLLLRQECLTIARMAARQQ